MNDDDVVRRAWVRRQLLSDRPPERTLTDVVRALVGVQAQDVEAAALCIRARTHGLTKADVYRAFEQRDIVLTWSFRGTRHVHLPSDLPWVLALCGPTFGKPGRRAEQLGVGGAVGDSAVSALHGALASQGPLTRAEVKDLLAPHGVDPTGQASIHVVRRAALEGVLYVVPRPGADERYELLPEQAAVDRGDALQSLARRYLDAYAPASPADFSSWSGLGASAAKRAWAELSAGAEDDIRVPSPAALPLRLLGAFDALLLGHADRSLIVPEAHARRVNAGGGMVKPVMLAGGQVVGTWTINRRRREPEVVGFRGLTAREGVELQREGADVIRFLELA